MNKEQLTALVAQAQKGDQDAFAQVYNASFSHVFYTARKILQDEQLAQDIAQDVFITVYQKLGELRDPGAYMGWVRQITAYKCSNYVQKRKEVLYNPIDDEDEDSDLPDVVDDVDAQPDAVLEKASTKQIILDIIDQLPTERRAIVMMFYFQQLSIQEISAATGKAEGTIKASLNTARKQIKMAVEKEEERSNIKLHSISALFLFRLFSEDAAASIPASAIPQSILDNILAQGVAGQAATGTATASQGVATTSSGTASTAGTTGAATGKAAAAKGLSLGAKIGLGAAGVAVVGGIVGFVALSMNGNSAPVSSLPLSQPITSSAPVSMVTDDSVSVISAPESEEPTIGLPLFGDNDLAFLSKYLYPGQNADEAPTELTAYLGAEPIAYTAEVSAPVRDERYYYWMDNVSIAANTGLDTEGIQYFQVWMPEVGAVSGREQDACHIALTIPGYSILGIEYGMDLADAHTQAQLAMSVEGMEVQTFTDSAISGGYYNSFEYQFTYDGCEYLLVVYCPAGGNTVESVALTGVRIEAGIDEWSWRNWIF